MCTVVMSTLLFVLFLLSHVNHAFVITTPTKKCPFCKVSTTTKLNAETKKLSASDILKRARQSINKNNPNAPIEDEEEDEPKFKFDETVLDAMRTCLQMLEKRVKEGPGSIEESDIDQMEILSKTIIDDMKSFTEPIKASPPPTAPTAQSPPPPPPPVAVTPVQIQDAAVVETPPPVQQEVVAAATPEPAAAEEEKEIEYYETSDEEGTPYQGKGGMGLAPGTTNTYVIPNMDEMSPEEYRDELQRSVSARQSKRKDKMGVTIGNRASGLYMDNLKAEGYEMKSYPKAVKPPPPIPTSHSPPPPITVTPVQVKETASVVTPKPATREIKDIEYYETSDEEGTPYQGKGGMGLAPGTTNTYIIPNMDEMSPEEYRDELQRSVSARQSKRKDKMGVTIGNRASGLYMDNLKAEGYEMKSYPKAVKPPPPIPTSHSPPPPITVTPVQVKETASVVTPKPATGEIKDIEYYETSDEEGTPYQGKGGMGLAPGTTNTYIIPNMDEMSPEEYRDELQRSVSARQSKRKDKMGVTIGNRASGLYMDNLKAEGYEMKSYPKAVKVPPSDNNEWGE